MTTPLDIITQSLRKAGITGIGQTPSAEDTNDAFLDVNDMLAQWQVKRWMVFHLLDVAKVSTGAQSYTVGPGGDFNVAVRPDRLEDGNFFRQLVTSSPNQVDYPLSLIEARETYNRIALKQLSTFPGAIFYDAGYPLGTIYPWPVPQASIYEIHICVKAVLNQFTTLNQTINLPANYMAAIKWNLAIRLRVSYQMPVDAGLVALAKDSLNLIKNSNTQIPSLTMPRDLVRYAGNYNPYSDNTY